MTPELKPCPHYEAAANIEKKGFMLRAVCEDAECGSSTRWSVDENYSVALWNRRASPPPHVEATDDQSLWRFWNDKAREQAATIADLRQQLSEARADKRMVDDLLTAAVADYNDAIGEIKARSDAYEQACRERDKARAKALDDAITAVNALNPQTRPVGIESGFRARAAAAIRALIKEIEGGE